MFTMMLKGVEEQKEWDLLEDLKKKKKTAGNQEIVQCFSIAGAAGILICPTLKCFSPLFF